MREGERLFVEMQLYSLFAEKKVYAVKVEIHPSNSESFFTTGGLGIQFSRASSGRALTVKITGVELSAATSTARSSVTRRSGPPRKKR